MARMLLSITKMYSYGTIEEAEKDIAEMRSNGYEAEWVNYGYRVEGYSGEYNEYIMDDYYDEDFKYSVKYFK